MPKQLTNFRASILTLDQLDKLAERWGTDRTETVTIAVDRVYRQEESRFGRFPTSQPDCLAGRE
jgi:hypothetical protein